MSDLDLRAYDEADIFRLRHGRDLTIYNRAKFYGPTSKREVGYTDYLTWEESQESVETIS